MNNKNDRMDLNNSFRKTQKKINDKKRICLYPNCSKEAVSSHSQQENRSLKSISRDGHVYALNADLGHSYKFENDEFTISFKLTGIRKASTFIGFCPEHENIFKIFEQRGLDFNNQDGISYLHYRTLMYTYSKIRKEIERINHDLPQSIKTYTRVDSESIGKERLINLNIELLNFYNQSNAVIKHIENNDENFLSSLGIELQENIGISCSGNSILKNNANGNNPIFSFNILPYIDSTIIVISWLRAYDNQASWLIDFFKKDLELLINFLAFYCTEDICINPDLWEYNDEIRNIVQEINPLLLEENKIQRVLKIKKL